MSVCQQAIRARKKAKLDKRYKTRDAETSRKRLERQIANERAMKSRKKR